MKLNVLYSSDDNYAKYAGVSILSLFNNNKYIEEISVYIIDNNISLENKGNLLNIASNYGREIIFVDGSDLLEKSEKKDDFPIAAYGRLFISKLIDVDKVLYLDCDTIINSSLEKLWLTNIENYLIAGVQDTPAKYNVSIIGMNENDRYINSGVLLINIKLWKMRDIENRFVKFINKYRGEVPHHDQGILNGVCKNEILVLDPEFNLLPQFFDFTSNQIMELFNMEVFYSQIQIDKAIENPVIVHYICKFYNRPWNKDCTHPLKYLYEKYLILSPWENNLNNSPLSKQVLLRKKVAQILPFSIYLIVEKALDIKRKIYLKRKYKFL